MRRAYQSDLSDAEWGCLEPHLPAPKANGRPRLHSPREILDAILYVLKSGCAWRLLPHDFPPWRTVYHYFRRKRHLLVDTQGLVLMAKVHRANVTDRDGIKLLLEPARSGFLTRLSHLWLDASLHRPGGQRRRLGGKGLGMDGRDR